MISRDYWLERVHQAWRRRPLVWLSGVRRVGKTTLARMLPDAIYMNCDLPSVGRMLADPELFCSGLDKGSVVVFDEVHRLADPSRLLKIVADEYPHLRVLATGSSTLAATRKFRDSLTGRKVEVHLCPVLWDECAEPFGVSDFDRRLLHGGLPEALLASKKDAEFYTEWIDSFYARDVLELFAIRNRDGFLALLRALLRASGGQVDYTRLARASELSRPTVKAHLEALRIAHAVHLLRPFHGGGRGEIVSRPKCYAFDTGFVTFEKGWERIRDDDRGLLWEHLVLDTLRARAETTRCFTGRTNRVARLTSWCAAVAIVSISSNARPIPTGSPRRRNRVPHALPMGSQFSRRSAGCPALPHAPRRAGLRGVLERGSRRVSGAGRLVAKKNAVCRLPRFTRQRFTRVITPPKAKFPAGRLRRGHDGDRVPAPSLPLA